MDIRIQCSKIRLMGVLQILQHLLLNTVGAVKGKGIGLASLVCMEQLIKITFTFFFSSCLNR